MQNSVISAVMAALLASTLVSTHSVAAEGDYYYGVDPHAHRAGSVDLFHTNSVRYGFPVARGSGDLGKPVDRILDSGDYYEGAIRPQ